MQSLGLLPKLYGTLLELEIMYTKPIPLKISLSHYPAKRRSKIGQNLRTKYTLDEKMNRNYMPRGTIKYKNFACLTVSNNTCLSEKSKDQCKRTDRLQSTEVSDKKVDCNKNKPPQFKWPMTVPNVRKIISSKG